MFFLLILNIDAGMIIASYYTAAFIGDGMSRIFPLLFKYLLIISSGLIIYPVFIVMLNLYRTRISNLKKIIFGSAAFLTPNLVFSSSIIRNQISEEIKLLDYSGNYFQGVINNPFNFISLTVAGYFFICVSSLVFFLYYYTKNRTVCSRLDPAFGFLGNRSITNREKEIIRLVMDGCSNKQIGDKLFISLSTVKTHIYSIFRKMNVRSRVQLTVLIQKLSGTDLPE